jgi:hypothetical protein
MEAPEGYHWRDRENALRFYDHLMSARLQLSFEELMAKRFIAVRLEDCWCNGDIYESKDDAVRMVRWGDPNKFLYMQIPMERMTAVACDAFLWYCRGVYKAGYRPAGSHEGANLIVPQGIENYR